MLERAAVNQEDAPACDSCGAITVRVARDGNRATIEVADTGRGMPAHVLESILVGQAISTKPGGTGLGTSIVKKMIEAQGVF